MSEQNEECPECGNAPTSCSKDHGPASEPSPPTGWMGEEDELIETLRVLGAETTEDGGFKVFNQPVCRGLDGSVVVHQLTECLIKGEKRNVAGLMKQTGRGVLVIVM